jgi:hypothetical protein
MFGLELRASARERQRLLPGDDLVSDPVLVATHAVTLAAPPAAVWPWLVQMGAGRGGWYTWDFLDNRGHRSAESIVPELQRLSRGDVMPALPGATDAFVVEAVEPERHLVLGVPAEGGGYRASWTLVLEACEKGRTRLLVRATLGYRPFSLPGWLLRPVGHLGHHVMQCKQLAGIRRRVAGRRVRGTSASG